MLTPQQVQQFERDGFLNGGRVLDEQQIGELRHELQRVIERSKRGFAASEPQPVAVRNLGHDPQPVVQVINIWQASEAFRRLVFHPAIVGAISQFCNYPDMVMFHDQVVYKPSMNGGIVPWHQDAPYWSMVTPTTPVSAWVALDDVDDDNGAMWMVPGSHRWGDAMAHLKKLGSEDLRRPGACAFEPPADAPIRAIEPRLRSLAAGEVSYHHALTWHCSGLNRCQRPRRAIAIHYVSATARLTDRPHEVRKLTPAPAGESMSHAGPAFPFVCRGGQPVAALQEMQ